MFKFEKEQIKNNMIDGIPVLISNSDGSYHMKGHKLDKQIVDEIIIELDGRVETFKESFFSKIFYCPDLPSFSDCREMMAETLILEVKAKINHLGISLDRWFK